MPLGSPPPAGALKSQAQLSTADNRYAEASDLRHAAYEKLGAPPAVTHSARAFDFMLNLQPAYRRCDRGFADPTATCGQFLDCLFPGGTTRKLPPHQSTRLNKQLHIKNVFDTPPTDREAFLTKIRQRMER